MLLKANIPVQKTGGVDLSRLERGARHRLVAIGLPRQMINPLVDLSFKWVRENGTEWTVSRLKAMKLGLIRKMAGLSTQDQFQWVRKNSRGLPYGVFGSIMRWCLLAQSEKRAVKRFNIVLQGLNIASLFTNEKVTLSQFQKFMDGVNSDENDNLELSFYLEFAQFVKSRFPLHKVTRGSNELITYRGSPTKWAPQWHSTHRVRQSDQIMTEMSFAAGKSNYEFAWKYNELYAPVTRGIRGPKVRLKINPDKHLYGGEVHFLQEPGLKLRAIASPYRIHQLALKPIGDAIYSVVERLPWDCTFNQSKAMQWIQKSLSEGKVVHSIDLTGATDYFPLGLQLEALRAIFGDIKDIELIEEISRLRWKSEKGDIQWKRGQPLGLYPSFGMFTLTHGLLLLFLLKKQYDHQFFVVGDDVVILDDDLFKSYTHIMDVMKCPWSPSKSLSSSLLSEFAGKVITKDVVLPVYKWRKMSNDNFLDLCRNLGPKSRVLLTAPQKQVFDSVKHLLEPVGLNMSYPGSTLYSMMKETDKFLRVCEKHVLGSLVDLVRVIHRNSYGSHTPYALDLQEIKDIQETFDEKVLNVFGQTVFRRCKTLWRCVSDIPEALGLSPRLPPDVVIPKRISTLVRYKRLIKLQE
jgi:hypothetical protein